MSLTVSVLVVVYVSAAYLVQHRAWSFKSTVCYEELGCFSSAYPFRSTIRPISTLPMSPDFLRTQFVLYTRDNYRTGLELDARMVQTVPDKWTHFNASRDTKLIVHGFIDNYRIMAWLKEMKDELLVHGDYNVIIVDWGHGNLPPYTQATANTRVVGAQIALLIRQLQEDFNTTAGQIHIIGHSLGAQIAGYAGERTAELGRISGLDPAGPYFSGTDELVRLDPTDAVLVDSIHSDGKEVMKGGTGFVGDVGHMDFYPNLGYDQPGCERPVLTLIRGGLREFVACDHLRAIKFFTESINTKCPFIAFTCDNEIDFVKNKCHGKRNHMWASMGFMADKRRPAPGNKLKYYTTTADVAPYCQYHMDIIITLANRSEARSERGLIQIRLHGDDNKSKWLRLDKKPILYQPGSRHERRLDLPDDLGNVTSVEFKWRHLPSFSDITSWDPFKLRRPAILVQEMEVVKDGEEDQGVRFCTGGQKTESGKTDSFSERCL